MVGDGKRKTFQLTVMVGHESASNFGRHEVFLASDGRAISIGFL